MPPARFLYDLHHCPLRRALDVLGEKWTLLILREAVYGVRRFDDFARALSCGRGVLSARLKRLAAENLLVAREYTENGQRPRTEYHLTDKGRDLFPAMLALSQWSERWEPPPDGPVATVAERKSGQAVRVIITAHATARALGLLELDIRAGPGAKRLDGPGAKRRGDRTSLTADDQA